MAEEKKSDFTCLVAIIVIGVIFIGGRWLYHEIQYKWYNSHGIAYLSKNEYAKAIEYFSKAITLSKNKSKAYYSRALAYEQLGKHEQALEDKRIADGIEEINEMERKEDDQRNEAVKRWEDRVKTKFKEKLKEAIDHQR